MNNHNNETEQPSTEPAPKRPRRKYKPKLGAAGLSAHLAKRGSFRTSWEGLFFDIKGR